MSASNSSASMPDTTNGRRHATAAALMEEGSTPLNPSDWAFWFGLGVVLLSVFSALASYLILTGLTAIAPRNEYVWTALACHEGWGKSSEKPPPEVMIEPLLDMQT